MSNWNRRSVLVSGISLSVGSGIASISAGSSESTVDDLPDPALEPNPERDEDWASYRGDAGHARYIANGHEFDGESLEVAWTVDPNGSVAVADGTVYTTDEDGVVALDAADGTIVWENQTVDANAPAVVGDTVYLTGSEVVALDRADGRVRWASDFDPQESISKQTVAYEMVYVVVDGTLYALDADDGSVVWENESVTDEASSEAYAFTESTAAANGVVYAVTEEIVNEVYTLALEPDTGDEVWRARGFGSGAQPIATSAAVALDNMGYYQRTIQDPQTGEEIQQAATEYTGLSLGTEIFIGGDADAIHARLLGESEDRWEKSVFYGHIGDGVISGETVYIYFRKDPSISVSGGDGTADYSQTLVALDKYDGTEKWAISIDEMPVGEIRAISGATVYVDHDGELVALRDQTADEDSDGTDDTDGDTDDTDDSDKESDNSNDSGGETDNADDESDDTDEDTEKADESGDTGNTDEESSDTGGDADDTGEDQNETDEAGSDCPDEGTGSTCGKDNTEPSTDNSESSIDSNETSADRDGGNTSNGDETDTTDNETADTDGETDDADGAPGFTTGTGLLGGALGLEWLRRRAGVDDPDE
ncbi:outer membrane protein assembly factor BamB family protein [Halostagnicola kamekurae]|uniref:PQQ-like domain-containing protein n=1 Tax=Halostagnicola kamekurae TaxID=619731 RepID=A0A1I6QE17_9EURY|nr:PQQ-like beta-propeller repeat protein [Halostagnicola kamekurae]SFS50520.1 PQQ-like domain-containing protein [Halostagnicola kamekurae]